MWQHLDLFGSQILYVHHMQTSVIVVQKKFCKEQYMHIRNVQQVFEENLAINLDPEKLMYLFIYLFIYTSCRCGTGRSFDAKIVKLGWFTFWRCKMCELEDGTC